MKTLLKVVIGLVVVFALAIAAIFFLTADMGKTADQFFGAVKAKDYGAAYQLLSEDFRASTPQPELTKFLDRSALLRFREASWTNRSISGGRGELEGSVTTEGGGVVPIKLGFVKENGKWLIYSIHKPQAGLARDASGKMPSEAEQVALVKDAMRVFARSVNADDFSEFHKYVAVLWQRQVTVKDLDKVFKPFMENDIDLSPLERVSPAFDGPPSLDEQGVLVITGHFPTKPSRVLFKLSYVYEGVSWRLVGTKVNVEPAG